MSRSPSDAASSDPLRPSDHSDGDAGPTQPALGFVGWIRWAWRQLTSMRTALVLLLLLAIAAIPGSLVPQRTADPNGVTTYFDTYPQLAPILDSLQLFDVYGSVWFSAIYLLLFVSLIGCVIPRAKHHAKALRARPPRTPARLKRLSDYETRTVVAASETDASALGERAATAGAEQLRRAGYRVERDDAPTARSGPSWSVSAERGYLRETGNLVFHIALVGILITVGVGGGFAYTGQRVIVEGTTFVNSVGTDYSSFTPGRFVDGEHLVPYAMTLDSFDVSYEPAGTAAAGQAGDFSANITVREPGRDPYEESVRVNHPAGIAGDQIYLLGNGYAPTLTVRDAEGRVVYSEAKPFLPQDTLMTSLGIVKISDGLPEQVGLVGFFYPTQAELETGAYTSTFPDLYNPVMTLNVFAGDLGIDDGTPRSVYELDTSSMEQLTGADSGVDSIELRPGESAELPNGWGSVTFENDSPTLTGDVIDSVKRFASLQIHRDVSATWVLFFALTALGGLLAALFVPRRRVWIKATAQGDRVMIEYAGLARGEDPTLAEAVGRIARDHGARLGLDDLPEAPDGPGAEASDSARIPTKNGA